MTPQQKCAERIYELLPHKKELEFGCEIKIIDYSGFGLLDKDAQNREYKYFMARFCVRYYH